MWDGLKRSESLMMNFERSHLGLGAFAKEVCFNSGISVRSGMEHSLRGWLLKICRKLWHYGRILSVKSKLPSSFSNTVI